MVGDTLERFFLRVKVAIPVSRPIPTGFYLNRDRLPKTWIQFKYERILESYCLNCGIIGHNKKECKIPTTMSIWNPNEPRYSAGLGVAQARALKPKEYRVSREESSSGQKREVAREEHDWRKGGESTQETAGSKADSAQEKEWGIEEESIAEAPRRTDKDDHRDVEKGKNTLEDLLVRETEIEGVERDARDWVKENKNVKDSKRIYEKGKEMGGPSVLREESAIKGRWADFCQRPNENIYPFRIGPQGKDNNLTIGQPLEMLNNKELEQDNKQIYTAADGSIYYVELVNEEDELEPNNSKALVVATEYEMELVQGMEKKLKLKRKREDEQQVLMGNMVGEKASLQVWKAGKRSKKSSGPAGVMPIEEDQQNKEEIIEDSIAEEAGLNMPPNQL
ncbi:kinesin KP1-like isoform [Arachis hypogaea]|nr:kinesin KP1-like isoform [Arachis hypogaea]